MKEDTVQGEMAADAEVDCVGQFCPLPISETKQGLDRIAPGQVLKVEADDPGAEADIPSLVERMGHELLRLDKDGDILVFYIRKVR